MSSCTCARRDDAFPLLAATTRNFANGAPRSFVLSEDGLRIAFVRSDSGDSARLDLWLVEDLDHSATERLVIRANDLLQDDENLSPAERARRERLRESGSGITSFSADAALTTVAFALSGQLWIVDVTTGASQLVEPYANVVDPRLNRQGSAVAFTSGSDFVVYNLSVGQEILRMTAESDTVTYGLADFVASEELNRYRGHWWSPDGNQLLVERNDESNVAVRYISDPTYPETEPRPHRYPQAGTTNSSVSLWLAELQTGTTVALDLPMDRFEYLAAVNWSTTDALITLLSRDQQHELTFALKDGELEEILARTDAAWIDCGQGLPRLLPDGRLLHSYDSADRHRLVLAGDVVDFFGLHIDSVIEADDDGCVVAAFGEPWQLQIWRIEWDGTTRLLSDAEGYAGAISRGGTTLLVQSDLDHLGARYLVLRAGSVVTEIESLATDPGFRPEVTIEAVGDLSLPTAVVFPRDHAMGTHSLPVVVSIYGGPHHQEVVAARKAYLEEQWLADQGYAVVIIDNRGAPGRSPEWERAIHHDLRHGILSDQVQALEALFAKYPDDLDRNRVGITGWSFGGYLAAMAVIDRPDVYHAAWSGAPVTDWHLYDTAYTERYLGNPNTNQALYEESSLVRRAHQLTRPLAIVHGLADDNVLSAHSLQLSGALLSAGRPHQFLPLAGVSHMTPQVSISSNLKLLMRDFFDRNL